MSLIPEPTIDDLPGRRKGPHAPPPVPPTTTQLETPSPQKVETFAEEDPRTRAARRAAELRDHLGPDMGSGVDKFYIDPRVIPPGWSYEWKRRTTYGKDDPSYQVQLAYTGWDPVPASRHPEMMPDKYHGEAIERDGMMLMERPLEITEESRQLEKRVAREQVRHKEQQLTGQPAGQNSPFDATNKGDSMVKIRKSYEPLLLVPKE